ncbi:acyl-CoA carboxylase epsilon subunit [Streptomyces malaysiensis]|uniref:Acyl-CoA carboxylase subunit epsilon n=1 Tax=Streptomyces malaysiensis subsp. samsunensis TaxID=459658 RepID=A0A9X2RVA3_STRMQ|nr:acyl-CoA carboxylase epsilon subunit [Streptomyces samsunensis]MCQ8832077.1 acyl-CoA carboxylase subunit epsilon [Streptomyces samsunensis]
MTIKILQGNPTSEKLAAVLAVVRARAAAASSVPAMPKRLDEWADKEPNIPRHTLAQPGPTTWRGSYRPR